jgi:hypothetical protein
LLNKSKYLKWELAFLSMKRLNLLKLGKLNFSLKSGINQLRVLIGALRKDVEK